MFGNCRFFCSKFRQRAELYITNQYIFMKLYSNAQGTIEYLVILAVIVVISLVVVSLMANSTAPAGQITAAQSKLFWGSQPISITDSSVDAEGQGFFVIEPAQEITLKKLIINGVEKDIEDTKIFGGNKKTIYLEDLVSCTSETGVYEIEFEFDSSTGLPYVSGGYLVLDCEDDIDEDDLTDDEIIEEMASVNYFVIDAGSSTHNDFVSEVKIDEDGDIFVAGVFAGTASFGDIQKITANSQDVFLGKIDGDTNEWLWVVSAGAFGSYTMVTDIAIDSAGYVYMVGSFQSNFGDLDLWDGSTLTRDGLRDIFIVKVDGDTNQIMWVQSADGTRENGLGGITLDGSGNVYVAGAFEGNTTFGAIPLSATNGQYDQDIFVAQLSPAGNWNWVIGAGSTGDDFGYNIELDSEGDIIVSGRIAASASFDAISVNALGSGDPFLGKLDPDTQNWIWVTSAGGTSTDSVASIGIDSLDDIYITGSFYETAYFGANTLISNSWGDAFVAKVDGDTNEWLWVNQIGQASEGAIGDDYCYGVVVDSSDNIYVTGRFFDSVTLGFDILSTTISDMYDYDIFIAKADSSGNWLWAKSTGADRGDSGMDMTLTENDNPLVVGGYTRTVQFDDFTLASRSNFNQDVFVWMVQEPE